ncbi:hypothetical protein [Janthinobacterium violaceinigrum]|uniref:Uncharacterized protein n=1 Tax=Janthinobacterium violaceinigrum TaxID=2654252 RepID=A0A6I1I7A7_9BURK|nr:hypothetical protein [Janthinobacterium violaceinigrum]KAB8066884.1 hypothetical protein GCN75_01055 [Janthinobacterium violaceinigrum]
MGLNLRKLHELLFYAIDKASPCNLALDNSSNTLGKIADKLLTDLKITPQGKSDMWQIVDTSVRGYAGGEILPSAIQSQCATPMEMWEAQCKASKVAPVPEPDNVL